jgi:hypothetical protein
MIDEAAMDRLLAEFGPTLSIADFRWCSYYRHPLHRGLAVILRFGVVIAIVPKISLRWLRYNFLYEWKRRFRNELFTESDVAAHVVDWLVTCRIIPSVPDIPRFTGCDHGLPEWMDPWDATRARPASLSRSRSKLLNTWDPATSAFTRVLKFASPLKADNIRELFGSHPYGTFLHASVLFGYSLLTYVPSSPRWMRDSFRPGKSADSLRKAFDKEIACGGVTRVPPSASREDIRVAPFFAVPKPDGGVRGISDMSAGEDDINSNTRRMTFSRLRLAKLYRIVERIVYMKTQRPGVRIMLVKMDVSRAFRQFPAPVRDFLKTVHIFNEEWWANVRLMMGATASGDSMATVVSACRDYIAEHYGWFSESYIDDWMIVLFEDEVSTALPRLHGLWDAIGLPENIEKFEAEGAPATTRVFLGVMVDTEAMTLSISEERSRKLTSEINDWLNEGTQRSVNAYAKLAGKLGFCSAVLSLGRAFLAPLYRRGWAPSRELYDEEDRNTLPTDVRESLQWWLLMLKQSHSIVSFRPNSTCRVLNIFTDASHIGYGAVAPCLKEYSYGAWTEVEREQPSSTKWEMAAILFAVSIWGPRMAYDVLVIHTDSAACASIFRRNSAHNYRLSVMLRVVSVLQIVYRVQIAVVHIPGVLNYAADYLSRDLMPPPPCYSWLRRSVLPKTRQLGQDLLRQPPLVPNLAPNEILEIVRCPGSFNIVMTPATPSLPILRWTSWRHRKMETLARVECSISADGWWRRVSIPQLQPFRATFPPLGSDVSYVTDGSLFSPQCCSSSSCVRISIHEKNVSVTPPPANS